jgi:hypothetical protein
MQGMSERQYAERVGLSRGAIQKARKAERLVLFPDGSIDAEASDARRAETTDPAKTRKPPAPTLKPVREPAVAAVGDTLREQGLVAPAVSRPPFGDTARRWSRPAPPARPGCGPSARHRRSRPAIRDRRSGGDSPGSTCSHRPAPQPAPGSTDRHRESTVSVRRSPRPAPAGGHGSTCQYGSPRRRSVRTGGR